MRYLIALLGSSLALTALPVWAVPGSVPFVGELRYDGGAPYQGSVGVVATLYDAVSDGEVVWGPVDYGSVTVVDGVLAVTLGSDANPLDLDSLVADPIWLEVSIDATVMEPRMAVHSVPYALLARDAERLVGLEPDDFLLQGDVANPKPTGSSGATGANSSLYSYTN